MLWVLIRIALFLWKTDKNYPSIIIKYPPYLFFRFTSIFKSSLSFEPPYKVTIE